MTKILMCEPQFYDVIYHINPWMTREKAVSDDLAKAQWQGLVETIKATGAEVCLIPPEPAWPDLVFTANAGLVYDNKVYLSHFAHAERQGERAINKAWFNAEGYQILGDDSEDYASDGNYNGFFFEGAGDALFLGETLVAAYGFRSDIRAYEKICNTQIKDLVLCELVDNAFYHLDTCFCPLNDKLALWWPGAFSEPSRARLQALDIDLIAVPEAEAARFACNAVVNGQHVIVPSDCPQTETELQSRGFRSYSCEMSEFLKSGGACKCLTLIID